MANSERKCKYVISNAVLQRVYKIGLLARRIRRRVKFTASFGPLLKRLMMIPFRLEACSIQEQPVRNRYENPTQGRSVFSRAKILLLVQGEPVRKILKEEKQEGRAHNMHDTQLKQRIAQCVFQTPHTCPLRWLQ